MQFINFCKTEKLECRKCCRIFVVLFSHLRIKLPAITVSLEMEPELENVVVEMAAEAAFVWILPFTIHYFECNVFIRWPRVKPKHCKVWIFWTYFLKIGIGVLDFAIKAGNTGVNMTSHSYFYNSIISVSGNSMKDIAWLKWNVAVRSINRSVAERSNMFNFNRNYGLKLTLKVLSGSATRGYILCKLCS